MSHQEPRMHVPAPSADTDAVGNVRIPDVSNRGVVAGDELFDAPEPRELLRRQAEQRAHAQRLMQEKEALLRRAHHMRENDLKGRHAALMQEIHAYDVPVTREEHARFEDIHQRAAIAHAALSHAVEEATGGMQEHPALKKSEQTNGEGLALPTLGDQQGLHDTAPEKTPFIEPRHTQINFLDGVDTAKSRTSRLPRIARMDAARPIAVDDSTQAIPKTFVMEPPTYAFEDASEPTIDGEIIESEDEVQELSVDALEELSIPSNVAGHEQDIFESDLETRVSQHEQYYDEEFDVIPTYQDRVLTHHAELKQALRVYEDMQNPKTFVQRIFRTQARIEQARSELRVAAQAAQQSLRTINEYFAKRGSEQNEDVCKSLLVSSKELLMMSYRNITEDMWAIEDMESPEYRRLLPIKIEYIHLIEDLPSEVQWGLLIRDMHERSGSLQEQITQPLVELFEQIPDDAKGLGEQEQNVEQLAAK